MDKSTSTNLPKQTKKRRRRGCGKHDSTRSRRLKENKKRKQLSEEEEVIVVVSPQSKQSSHNKRNQTIVDYTMDNEEDINANDPKLCLHQITGFRIAVAYHFIHIHNAEPDEDKWNGHGGIIPDIRTRMKLNKNTRLDYILRDICSCVAQGIVYSGQASLLCNRGQKPIIDIKSAEAQAIADLNESGQSPNTCHQVINEQREQLGLPLYTLAAIHGCIKNMNPRSIELAEEKQGSNDEKSPLCQARYLLAIQNAVVFGLKDADEFVKKFMEEKSLTEVPAYFDKTKLKLIKKSDTTWFDETHIVVMAGSSKKGRILKTKNRKKINGFPRDKNGKFDPVHGTYAEVKISHMNVKYDNEVRLCLGMYMDQFSDGPDPIYIGKRCYPYDYTGKLILSPSDWDSKEVEEFIRVRELPNPGPWVKISKSLNGEIYWDDDVKVIAGIGKKKAKYLRDESVFTVKDLMDATNEKLLSIEAIGHNHLQKWQTKAKEHCKAQNRPEKIDYRKFPNPYLARFGPNWRMHLKKASSMSRFADARDLIDHIVAETIRAGKKHFYHDALCLMTCKESIAYMAEKGVLHMWIRPQLGLFEDYPELKRYFGRVVGNSAEMMPMDTTLNKDVHECVKLHVTFTNSLDQKHPKKFGMSTPKEGARSYKRIFDPVHGVSPLPERIVADITSVFDYAIPMIIQQKGKIIEDRKHKGRRYTAVTEKKSGGDRRSKEFLSNAKRTNVMKHKKFQTHMDARVGLKVKLELSQATFDGVKIEGADDGEMYTDI